MGKRGPKPQTDGEKAAAGRPTIAVELGECPDCLKGEARAEFERVKEINGGLIGGGDRAGFIRYCAMWGQWCGMEKVAEHEPFVIDGGNGPRVNPFWTAYRQLHRDLLATEDKFIMTPACRSRMNVDTSEPQESEAETEMFGQ
jgi:P27 family predicted phage terminase small subunit